MLKFRARIEIIGINPYVRVSATRVRELKAGWRRPLPVLVRVNGHPKAKPWRINMMPMGNGDFYLYLAEVVRTASKTKVGDLVDVAVEFDAKYRGGPLTPMPRAMKSALAQDAAARGAWDALTPSRKKEVIRYLVALKSAESLQRNVEKFTNQLAGRAKKGPILGA